MIGHGHHRVAGSMPAERNGVSVIKFLLMQPLCYMCRPLVTDISTLQALAWTIVGHVLVCMYSSNRVVTFGWGHLPVILGGDGLAPFLHALQTTLRPWKISEVSQQMLSCLTVPADSVRAEKSFCSCVEGNVAGCVSHSAHVKIWCCKSPP